MTTSPDQPARAQHHHQGEPPWRPSTVSATIREIDDISASITAANQEQGRLAAEITASPQQISNHPKTLKEEVREFLTSVRATVSEISDFVRQRTGRKLAA